LHGEFVVLREEHLADHLHIVIELLKEVIDFVGVLLGEFVAQQLQVVLLEALVLREGAAEGQADLLGTCEGITQGPFHCFYFC
jgi:hypothetical protein